MHKSGFYEHALVYVDTFFGWPKVWPVANATVKATAGKAKVMSES